MIEPGPSDRVIVGFRQDQLGDWIAELACGHHQHVRHAPPLQSKEWVLSDEGRASMISSTLRCRLCDQAVLPDQVSFVRSSDTFTESTFPRALERQHRMGRSTWGVIKVEEGHLRYVAAGDPAIDVTLDEGWRQAIPPDVEHEIHPLGAVRFAIDYYSINAYAADGA